MNGFIYLIRETGKNYVKTAFVDQNEAVVYASIGNQQAIADRRRQRYYVEVAKIRNQEGENHE